MKVYVARQPIFNKTGKIFGYEFLYRDSEKNEFNRETDGSLASCLLLANMLSEFGLEKLTGGVYAFLNLTEELLRSEYLYMIDPGQFIIEILEDVREEAISDELLQNFRKKGYRFALDDYTGRGTGNKLADFSDILKVDFMQTNREEQKEIACRYRNDKLLLAEKIETGEDLDWAVQNGYSLMQGFYFSRPVMLSKEKTEIALATYMLLLKEFARRDPDFDNLAQIIMMDVNLSYKFLLRVNTLQYCGKYRIRSVRQSLVRMGLIEVKRWMLAVLLSDVFGKNGNESAKRALIRGVFTEKLVELLKWENLEEEAYMVGMFSTIDVSIRESMDELLGCMRISAEARDALFERKGPLGGILDFVEAYEKGAWDELSGFIENYGLKHAGISVLYFESVKYAERMYCVSEDFDTRNSRLSLYGESPLTELLNRQKKR